MHIGCNDCLRHRAMQGIHIVIYGSQWRNKGGSRSGRRLEGAPMATFQTFQFFLLKKGWTIQAHAGGPRCHGPIFGPGVVLLVWIPMRVVKISDTGVSFFDKKTSLK